MFFRQDKRTCGTNGAIVAALLIAAMPVLSACSVGMAAAGKEDPDVRSLTLGSTRLEIERELGAPKSSRLLDDGGTEAVYEYELGNEPSTGRAIMHGGLDVLTLGLWEVVGTPMEALQGTKYEMTVVYGPDDVAKQVTKERLKEEPKKSDTSTD